MKKIVAALLGINALLIALLTAQSVQSAPKSYDAVKLAQYTACLNAQANWEIALMQVDNGNGSLRPSNYPVMCNSLKP
jgi:hypothetical protein